MSSDDDFDHEAYTEYEDQLYKEKALCGLVKRIFQLCISQFQQCPSPPPPRAIVGHFPTLSIPGVGHQPSIQLPWGI